MKPMELFPGAVVCYFGEPVVIELNPDGELRFLTKSTNINHLLSNRSHEALSPLPLSPAVLAGLGFVKHFWPNTWWCEGKGIVVVLRPNGEYWIADGPDDSILIAHAHQLQALALHLYGVELEWNQEKYEKAMKKIDSRINKSYIAPTIHGLCLNWKQYELFNPSKFKNIIIF